MRVQSEAGLLIVPALASAYEGLHSTESMWIDAALDDVLGTVSVLSDRIADRLANRLMQRTHAIDEVPLHTMVNVVGSVGEPILAGHGWEPDTQLTTPAAELAPLVGALESLSYAKGERPESFGVLVVEAVCPHDYPGGWVKQRYLPSGLERGAFYRPGSCGWEAFRVAATSKDGAEGA